MSNNKEIVNRVSRDYYTENTFKVRRNRLKLKIDRGKEVRLSTIEKYNLTEYAKAKGADVSYIEVNKMNKKVTRNVNDKVTAKVEKTLDDFDKEMKKLLADKKKQMVNFHRGLPLKSGILTLKDVVERINHVDIYENSTRLDHQQSVIRLFKYLKDDGSNVIGTFNDYENIIKKIRQFKITRGPNKGKSLKSYAEYFNIPVTLYNNILEVRSSLSPTAYRAYKNEYALEKNVSMVRTEEIRKNTEYADINELHLVRRFYANDAPGSIWHLVSSLYTLTPSVRNDYGCVKLIKDGKPEMDLTSNYYNVDKGEFILQKYKTKKRYGVLTYKFQKKLVDVINLWLECSGNTKYLITKKDINPNSKDTGLDPKCKITGHSGSMGKLISSTFDFYLKRNKDDMSIGIQKIRIIWVNALEKVKDVKKRTEFAQLMGHSLEIAKNVYLRGTFGVSETTSKKNSKYKDYGDPGYPHSKSAILKGIDLRFSAEDSDSDSEDDD